MREPDRIIRLKTVLARTGLSRSTIYRWRQPDFLGQTHIAYPSVYAQRAQDIAIYTIHGVHAVYSKI